MTSGRQTASRWGVIASAALTALVLNLDQATVLLAVPSIAESLDADLSAAQWMLSGFLLPLVALTLLAGRLADRFGPMRVLPVGLGLFLAGAVGSVFADGIEVLIAMRVLSGIGAAAAFPSSVALLRVYLPEGPPLRVALGLYFSGALSGSAIGPVVGGLLLRSWPWWSIFWLSAFFAVAALVPVGGLIGKARPSTDAARLPLLPSIAGTIGLALVVWGLIGAGSQGWASAATMQRMVPGLVVLGALAAFLRLRAPAGRASPIDPWRLSAGLAVMLLAILTVVGTMLFVITYMQTVLDYSPLRAGAAFMPFGVVAACISPFALRLLDRFGLARMLSAAVVLEVAGLVGLSRLGPSSHYVAIGIPIALVGASMAIFPGVSLHMALSAASSAHSGAVSGAHNVAIQLGQLLSIAIMGSFVAGSVGGIYRSLLADDGLSTNVPGEIVEDLGFGVSAAPPGVASEVALRYTAIGELAFTTAVGRATLTMLGAVAALALVVVVLFGYGRRVRRATPENVPSGS